MEKVKSVLTKFIYKIRNIILYISKGIIILILLCMVGLPFIIKNISFKGDDLNIYNTSIKVLAINGKVNIKALDTYIKTDISYDKYDNYVKQYNKSKPVKKVMILELYLLFILFEAICLYYILSNIIKIYVDPEEDINVKRYIDKYFCINVISLLLIGLFRKFLFRNTIFSSINSSTVIVYIFIIFMFLVVKKILEQNRVSTSKGKKYEKN